MSISTSPLIPDPASFRDPSGFIFHKAGHVCRAVAPEYFEHFTKLGSSGLYDELIKNELLVKHKEITNELSPAYSGYKILELQKIPFISYPYEWCFGQLKNAALLTLEIQERSLSKGLALKDASAFNVQFIGSKPIFIDTLSFEQYKEGSPWKAYGQFCRHFLAPLALASYRDPDLIRLSTLHLDGIPLDLANKLLPRRSLVNSVVLSHISLHSKFINSSGTSSSKSVKTVSVSKKQLLAMIQHLKEGISSMKIKERKSTWNNYHETHNYTNTGKEEKKTVILKWLDQIKPYVVWDLGCNTGEYSVLSASHAKYVISFDSDRACIEKLYANAVRENPKMILPLILDISNPTPAIGWDNTERTTVLERGTADLSLALALVHHLRISNNTPWNKVAQFLSKCSRYLIVEHISPEDSQIVKMLAGRDDIYKDLDFTSFENAFSQYYRFEEVQNLKDTHRTICLLKKKEE